ncbi:MAG: Rossmann-like domain-containing protein [bacterium]
MNNVYEILRDRALKLTADFKVEDFFIRGIWKVDLAFRPSLDERLFRYSFLVAQTVGQGTCYCDKDIEVDQSLIGKDAREVISEPGCYNIAILDSIYASIPRKPQHVYELVGNSIEKAIKRNAILVDEVEREISRGKTKAKIPTVVNVGALGILIKSLRMKGYTVYATDLDQSILGGHIHHVEIRHGSETYSLIKEADVAVITGMTLTTDTLGDIVSFARTYGTRIVMFAETGANFGEEYCRSLGIDVVVSEPFPFYIFQGLTRIEVYRREGIEIT